MWWLVLSAVMPGMVFAIFGCGSDRKDVKKEEQSKKSVKSKKGGASSKTTRSSKSRNPGQSSSKSRKSSKSSKSRSGKSKSAKSSSKSKSKSAKSASEKKIKAVPVKVSKSEKSAKTTTTASTSAESSAKIKSPTSVAAAVPNIVELRAEPAQMSFKKTGELQTFKFINDSNKSRAFKVKCSDNQMYRVTPVFGIVPPHGSATIDILRQNGAAKVEKLVLLTAAVDASASEKEYKQLLAGQANCQMTIVPLLVEA